MNSRHVVVKISGERDLVFRNEIEAEAYVHYVLTPRLSHSIRVIEGKAFPTNQPVNALMTCDEEGVWSYASLH